MSFFSSALLSGLQPSRRWMPMLSYVYGVAAVCAPLNSLRKRCHVGLFPLPSRLLGITCCP